MKAKKFNNQKEHKANCFKYIEMTKDSLFKALGLFIEAFRPYIVLKLTEKAGDKWDKWFYEALSDTQKDNWELGIRNGTPPVNLIDFHHLKSFAIKYKDILKRRFR